MKGITLISYSGGLDSTFLLYKNLKEGKTVLPVYVKFFNVNLSKSEIEIQQLNNILSLFSEEFPNLILPVKKIESSVIARTQFQNWVLNIKNSIDLENVKEIHFGATKSDIDKSFTIEDALSRIDYAQEQLGKEVKFPLIDLTKKEIGKILPKKYQELSISCEIPIYTKEDSNILVTQCGCCNACHLHKINDLKLNGPFKLEKNISDTEIRLHNADHYENIEYSNFYGQQNLVEEG